MRRGISAERTRALIAEMRDTVPGIAIRSTLIVGYPAETAAAFDRLMRFVEDTAFDRLGVFTYSPQEGTRGAELVDDVPEFTKRQRLEIVQELQRHITAERYESRIGTVATALIEAPRTEDEPARARLPWQADDIDGLTWIDTDAPAGSLVEVEVTAVVDDYDFEATPIRVVALPPSASADAPRSRALPLVSTTIGSFGR